VSASRAIPGKIGFRVDGSSQAKYKGAVDQATKQAQQIGKAAKEIEEAGVKAEAGAQKSGGATALKFALIVASLEALAIAAARAVEHVSDDLEKLAFQAQRAGSTVKDLRSIGFAASPIGIDTNAARAAVASA